MTRHSKVAYARQRHVFGTVEGIFLVGEQGGLKVEDAMSVARLLTERQQMTLAVQVDEQVDGYPVTLDRLGHGMDHRTAHPISDEHEAGVLVFLMKPADFAVEPGSVIELAVIGLKKAQAVQVVTDAGEVSAVERVEAADQEDIDV